MAPDPSKRGAHLRKTSVNLKIIPCVTGGTRIAELVAYNLTDITMHFHFSGPARLHLIPHINAPVADLPVRRVVEGRHFKADLTLPYGRVLHDYLAQTGAPDMSLKKTAVVTGSSSGIGLGIARGLAGAGMNIVLNGIEPEDQVDPIRRAIEADFGVKARYDRANLMDPAGVVSLDGRGR